MDLPTYTNIWRIEKRLYKLYDLRLPMPLPMVLIGVFLGVMVPWVLLLRLAHVPFETPWHVIYLVPPGIVAWLSTRPVIEGKRLTELLQSQLRYVAEPREWCRLAPADEPVEITVAGRIWRSRRTAVASGAARKPAPSSTTKVTPAAKKGRHAAKRRGTAAPPLPEPVLAVPVRQQRVITESHVIERPRPVADPPPAVGPAARVAPPAERPRIEPATTAGAQAPVGVPGPDPGDRPRTDQRRTVRREDQAPPLRRRTAQPIGADSARRLRALANAAPRPPIEKPDTTEAAKAAKETAAPPAGQEQAPAAREQHRKGQAPQRPQPTPPPARPREIRRTAEVVRGEDSIAWTANLQPGEEPSRTPPPVRRGGAGAGSISIRAVAAPSLPIVPSPATTDLSEMPEEPRPRRVESVIRRTDQTGGWRRLAQVVIGGGGRPGIDQAVDEARIKAVFTGSRRIVVLGCTGGAGQSTAALLLGHSLATHRDDRVVAVDAAQGAATLTSRIKAETPETLRSLLAGLDAVGGYLAMRAYTSRAPSGLEVIAADERVPSDDRVLLVDQHLDRAIRVLDRHYKLIVIDPAAAVAARVLPYADQLILVAPASTDASRSVAMTYEWLDGHGSADLSSRAILLVNGVSRRSMPEVTQAEAVARGRCRAIVRIPWDDQLGPGQLGQVELGALRPATRRAYLALGGVVASGFSAAKPEQEPASGASQ